MMIMIMRMSVLRQRRSGIVNVFCKNMKMRVLGISTEMARHKTHK
jgi:hypothetical protein